MKKATTAIERIKATLVHFAGQGLSAKAIAAEAGCSLSWAYRVLARLVAEGFVTYDHRDTHGLPTRARQFRIVRDAGAAYEAAVEAAELDAIEFELDGADLDAAYAAWAGAA